MKLSEFTTAIKRAGLYYDDPEVEFVGMMHGDEVHPSAATWKIEFVCASTNGTRKLTLKFLTPKPHYEETIH